MGLGRIRPARSRRSRSTLKHGTGFPHVSPGDDTRDGSARHGTGRLFPSPQALSLYSGSDPHLDSRGHAGQATGGPPPSYLIHPHWVVGQHRIARRRGTPTHGPGCLVRSRTARSPHSRNEILPITARASASKHGGAIAPLCPSANHPALREFVRRFLYLRTRRSTASWHPLALVCDTVSRCRSRAN